MKCNSERKFWKLFWAYIIALVGIFFICEKGSEWLVDNNYITVYK